MKATTQNTLNKLLTISSIALLAWGVSEEKYLIAGVGFVCFIVMLILRAKQVKQLNEDIKKMEEIIENETDDTEDK
jgi:hypothetical protein